MCILIEQVPRVSGADWGGGGLFRKLTVFRECARFRTKKKERRL